MFSKILIANRGEIACRVITTARRMGYRTVAVYSEADADARHVRLADEAVPIGPSPVGESYLNIERVLAACRQSGAEAVHPGYGFLSENEDFAQACLDAGLVFIGPRPAAIRLMGSKRLAKLAMQQAGVPCVPGYDGEAQDDATLRREAERIGFPLMIKASAGGGGRGMRLVESGDGFEPALRTARSEALNAFGSDELILEKAIIRPRHVEIQVFGDTVGHVVHLGERDCSIQRRHQKVVEESPCPAMTPELRASMGAAAVAAARACDYVGAGTVEFLLDAQGAFYFLEMNTRLQVEHPVTELVTGLDLVEWQLRVAAGEPLPLAQPEIRLDGHAIEVRLYAEDPAQQFLPQTGPVLAWRPGDGVRVDHGMVEGGAVSPYYDPMVAKLIAHGRTRDEAARKLARAVEDTVLLGLNHNRDFLAEVLRHPAFLAGDTHTGFIADHMTAAASLLPAVVTAEQVALAAALLHHLATPVQAFADWQRERLGPQMRRLRIGERVVSVARDGEALLVGEAGGPPLAVTLSAVGAGRCLAQYGERRCELAYAWFDGRLHLDLGHGNLPVEDVTHAPPQRQDAAGSGVVNAPMDGAVVDVRVAIGERVSKGQTLLVLEAMKIEHQLKADCDGVVGELLAGLGVQVKRRQRLLTIAAEAD